MHHMAARDDDLSMTCKPAALEHSLTEAATVFPPSGLGQVMEACGHARSARRRGAVATLRLDSRRRMLLQGTKSGGKRGGKKGGKTEAAALQSSAALRPRPETSPEAVDDLSALQPLGQHLYTPQAPVNRYVFRLAAWTIVCEARLRNAWPGRGVHVRCMTCVYT